MKKLLFVSTLLFSLPLVAQESNKQILAPRLTETALFLDPTEVQMFASITALADQNVSDYQYIPFGFGASFSLWVKQLSDEKAWEVFGELGTFTQFEWAIVDNEQQRNLLNTDYKAAISYSRQISNRWTYRLRFFHVSSHLGDDFVFRRGIKSHTTNKVNYEQLELSVFRNLKGDKRLNAGIASIVRPNALRLPFSFHLGYNQELWKRENHWGITYGAFLKCMQEHKFNPAIKLGAGPAFYSKHKKEPLRIVFEYYKGNLPYSQYEFNEIEWFGLGLYFYL